MKTKQTFLALSFALGIVSMAAGQTTAEVVKSTPKATQSTSRAADNAVQFAGNWKGTFQGSGAGGIQVVINQDQNGKTSGQVSIQPEGAPEFPFMTFETITLESNNLKATFTDWEGTKAQLEATLENSQLKGTWKTEGGQGGTWETTKAN